ncbi:enoyl-CoA hydratase-related protein [Francisellaceae bacterium]|nr:enoyl-CoA hydratase-related protein [Francisellaceae bacterium]
MSEETAPMKTVLAENVSGILKVTLNRPKTLNCLTPELINELTQIFQGAALDKTVHVIIVQGSGHNFMAGGDIRFFKGLIDDPKGIDVEDLNNIVVRAQNLIREIYDIKKPVIAAVEGAAAGFGLSLVAACDFAIATDKCVFTTAYSGIGLTPDGGASFILPRVLGVRKAKELMMLGEQFDSEEALAIGLLNQVVPADTLVSHVNKLAVRLQHSSHYVMGNVKYLANTAFERSLCEQLEAERSSFVACAQKEDFKIGVNAFLEKKLPKFTK